MDPGKFSNWSYLSWKLGKYQAFCIRTLEKKKENKKKRKQARQGGLTLRCVNFWALGMYV